MFLQKYLFRFAKVKNNTICLQILFNRTAWN